MAYDGGGWTQCLNAAFIQGAEALFTDSYAKVYSPSTTGYYDWCPQVRRTVLPVRESLRV